MTSLTFEAIERAEVRLSGVTCRTPLLESKLLNERLGFRLLIKAECLQRTGSFKMRGAYNKIASLSEAERRAGVVAFSSGNHAQAVAAAATITGVKARIVMPSDAPQIKLHNTAAYGAQVITYDRQTGDRAQIAKDLSEKTGAVIVPPYDDHTLMAGQGTVGSEIARQLEDFGIHADALICPVGGGGLIAGAATAMNALSPQTRLYVAEPEHFDDTRLSLEQGERVANRPGSNSICDAIVTMTPGELTFPINRGLLSGGLTVAEKSVLRAMKTALVEYKVVAEPGGAVALAAALDNRPHFADQTVVAVVSGGNVDVASFVKWISSADDV